MSSFRSVGYTTDVRTENRSPPVPAWILSASARIVPTVFPLTVVSLADVVASIPQFSFTEKYTINGFLPACWF